ncbi:antitoxin VbhA family protein [Bosea minatitlanensis]|jgi:hypothetical protein|uniref:Antitoxin VbhA domain-containing protein n=1 Tax=Bosea minatitlanensis TaxID=128782 RepID=A0ABW0F4C7_9HYPH|nr:hypothetical protein [Bosea minatitlanensis]MCT4494038.1 hypothetical protein [Bosea minatitlanensis]
MPRKEITEEEWRRLADAYRDYVPTPEPVDTDLEVARRREAAREAIGSMWTGGRRPTPEYLSLTERWIVGEISTEQMIEAAQQLWGTKT